MSYVKERPSWPIESPNKGRKKKANGYEEREIRSSLLVLDLKNYDNNKFRGLNAKQGDEIQLKIALN